MAQDALTRLGVPADILPDLRSPGAYAWTVTWLTDGWTWEMIIPGQLSWHGYVIPCRTCGVTGPWMLRVRKCAWIDGLDAGLICLHEHEEGLHPLIYPQFALRVMDAGKLDENTLARLDEDPDWVPHLRVETEPPMVPSSYDPPSSITRYVPWNRRLGPDLERWLRGWPGLWEAATGVGGAGD